MLPEKIEKVPFVKRNALIIRVYVFYFRKYVVSPLMKS
jgi:hypothetical protein